MPLQEMNMCRIILKMTDMAMSFSVYMPIKNSDGAIVGVLGYDYNASGVVEKLGAITKQIILIAVICLVAALLILSIIVGRIMRSLRRVDQKIYDLVHNEGDLTQKLEINTGDELELIANNVNALLEHIRKLCSILPEIRCSLTVLPRMSYRIFPMPR